MSEQQAEKQGLGIDWLRAVAGALAAVASAFLLSFLGAAGTIIGAALGSLIVTVSSAVFTQGLSTSKRTLEKAQAAAVRKVGIAQAEVRRAERADDTTAQDSHLEHADERLDQARAELEAVSAGGAEPSWRDRLRTLAWKRVLIGAGVLFVAAIVLITAFELLAGRSVSSITGGSGNDGTTIGHVGGTSRGGDRDDDRKDPDQGGEESPSPGSSEEPSPTQEPTSTDSTEPSLSPSGTPVEPSTEPPTEPPSETPGQTEPSTSLTP